MSVPQDEIAALLESGVEIPEDPVEIERLLAEQAGTPPEPQPKPTDDDTVDDLTDEEAAAKAAADKAAADEAAAKAKDEPVDTGQKEPPAAVLRHTRESLHQTEELLRQRDEEIKASRTRIDELEGRIVQLTSATETDKQGLQEKLDKVTDTGVKIEDLTDERIAEIREEAGDEAADLLAGLAKQYKALDARFQKLEESAIEVQQRREAVEAEQLQNDIDAVPLLAAMHAQRGEEADTRWQRAVTYEKVIRNDPDFQGKSRREVYEEVSRRMARFLGDDVVKELTGAAPSTTPGKKPTHEQIVDEALKGADERATPTSLSDLPAGRAAAQNELERAQGMSLTDIEESLDKALEKGGEAEVDLLLSRLTTME